jgi:hypothetical protein
MAKLNMNRGTTYNIGLTYQKNGVATSLVGSTIRFTMKSSEYSDNSSDSDASVVKNITTGDENGAAAIVLVPSDTALLDPGTYYYDIKIDVASDGSEVYKLDEGTIKLDGSPTNRLS